MTKTAIYGKIKTLALSAKVTLRDWGVAMQKAHFIGDSTEKNLIFRNLSHGDWISLRLEKEDGSHETFIHSMIIDWIEHYPAVDVDIIHGKTIIDAVHFNTIIEVQYKTDKPTLVKTVRVAPSP